MDNPSNPDGKLEELIKETLKEHIDGQEIAPEIKDRVRQNLGLKQKRGTPSSRTKFFFGAAAAIVCITLGSVLLFPGQVNAFSMALLKRFGYFLNNTVYNISETYRPDSGQKLPPAPPPENGVDSSLYKKLESAKKDLPFDLRIPQYLPTGLELTDVRIEGEKPVMQVTLEYEGEGKNLRIIQRGISTNSSTGMSYDVEDTVVKNITIGDFPATLFLMKNERVMIYWREQGIFYKLSGNVSESDTITIANNLSK